MASGGVVVLPGQVIEGKYRVERVIGEGSMGVVAEATHLALEERVALKFLTRHGADSASGESFTREARAAVKLRSAHVARVYDVGVTERGEPFIVMEYLEGSDLAALLELRGKLPVGEAAECIVECCEGLAEAHALGIVHCDVKPENLFLSQRAGALKQIKILDFGIARPAQDDVESGAPRIKGSPRYLSPERIDGKRPLDGRADIWSLGVVLYELVAGRPPFEGRDLRALLDAIQTEPHVPLATAMPEAPPGLSAIVDRCLAKDPAGRYPNAAALAIALLPFAPRRAHAAAERAAELAGESFPHPDSATANESRPGLASVEPRREISSASPVITSQPPAKRSRSVVFAGVALVALGVGLAILWTSMSGTRAVAGPATPTASAAAPSWSTVRVAPSASAPRVPVAIDPTPTEAPPPLVETAAPRPRPATPRAPAPASPQRSSSGAGPKPTGDDIKTER